MDLDGHIISNYAYRDKMREKGLTDYEISLLVIKRHELRLELKFREMIREGLAIKARSSNLNSMLFWIYEL